MRAGELACLKWSEINFDHRLIIVQKSFNGPTKNGEVRYVPILDILLPILLEVKRSSKSDFVFPNANEAQLKKCSRIFQETLHKVQLEAGLGPKVRDKKLRHCIVFHDLRHTFASHWMMKGGQIFKLQKILGHKSAQMTQRYVNLELGAFNEDYNLFS